MTAAVAEAEEVCHHCLLPKAATQKLKLPFPKPQQQPTQLPSLLPPLYFDCGGKPGWHGAQFVHTWRASSISVLETCVLL